MLIPTITGLSRFESRYRAAPRVATRAARLAINDTIRWSRTRGSRAIRQQVNLTVAYLNTPGRFEISRFASDKSLEARLVARQRPTQLIRYGARQRWIKGKTVDRKRAGIRVKVKRAGRSRVIRQAFFVRLRRGTQEGGNQGIAVRNTEGLNLRKLGVSTSKRSDTFQVLYAPSVDQVFRGVREDLLPDIDDRIGQRFDHHFNRLLK